MTSKGGTRHTKRITLSRSLPVWGRKRIHWVVTSKPGPHPKSRSVPLGVLLRDVLEVGADMREVKRILNAGHVHIDGAVVHDIRRPVGIMDIVEVPKSGKHYRLQIKAGKLAPIGIDAKHAKHKYCKVVGKTVIDGGKIMLTTHDGRTVPGDNNVKPGATLVMSVPAFKMTHLLPMQPGVRCLVISGKHAGEIATLDKVIERVGSMDPEAQLKSGDETFITVIKYLFVVDGEFA